MDKWFLQNILNHYMLIILLNRIYNCLFHLSSNCVVKGEGQMLNGTDRALQLKVVWDTSIFWRNDFVWCITFDIVNQACSQSSLVEFWSSRFIKNKIRKVKKIIDSVSYYMYLLQVYSKTTGRTHYVQILTKEGYQLSLDFRSTLQKGKQNQVYFICTCIMFIYKTTPDKHIKIRDLCENVDEPVELLVLPGVWRTLDSDQ